jgi:hypothetical protein
LRGVGHYDLNFVAALVESTHQFCCLISRDAAAHSQDDPHDVFLQTYSAGSSSPSRAISV